MGNFIYHSSIGKIKIFCDFDFACWLVNSGRVAGGVYNALCNRIYL